MLLLLLGLFLRVCLWAIARCCGCMLAREILSCAENDVGGIDLLVVGGF